MTSAVPAAIDYLIGLAQQAVTGVSGAVVADGWTHQESPTMFGVGIAAPPFFEAEAQSETQGNPQWVGLGNIYLEEDFAIPCYIYVGEGGTDNSTVRTKAFAIWDAFLPTLKTTAGLTLGGALKQGRNADVSGFAIRGPRTAAEAEGGRYCLIQFSIHCQNLTS